MLKSTNHFVDDLLSWKISTNHFVDEDKACPHFVAYDGIIRYALILKREEYTFSGCGFWCISCWKQCSENKYRIFIFLFIKLKQLFIIQYMIGTLTPSSISRFSRMVLLCLQFVCQPVQQDGTESMDLVVPDGRPVQYVPTSFLYHVFLGLIFILC